MINILDVPNGMTIRQLKEWINHFPDYDPYTQEEHEVWIETKDGLSSPITKAYPLNRREDDGIEHADLLLG